MSPRPGRRVAVIGAGISGLSAAWSLASDAQVTLFEADARCGGHAHTVDLTLDGITHGVDTGFLVFNDATYPKLIRLFAALEVPTAPSDMSFSVQLPDGQGGGLEWSGSSLDTVFAQRGNLLRPRFLGMLADLLRFNRLCTGLAERGDDAALGQPLGDFLDEHRFGAAFREGYLLPMLGCIWSCPTGQMLRFPVATMVRFCHNHGLFRILDRPQWRTVRGGSREYVRRMVASLADVRTGSAVTSVRRVPPVTGAGPADAGFACVWVHTADTAERFDEVVLAGHSDQSLALLGEGASADERAVLGAIGYQRNRALLHTDSALLPRSRKAWAAWNYERSTHAGDEDAGVCLHYLINRLQPLPWQQPVIVSLNPAREPRASQVHGEFDYAHPVFDQAAIAAQARLPSLQGRGHLWFAGAWTGYGFHEDGLASGLAVADALRQRWALPQLSSAPAERVAA